LQKGSLSWRTILKVKGKSSVPTRFYGVVLDVTETGRVLIELADDAVIRGQCNSAAVYVHPPQTGRNRLNNMNTYHHNPGILDETIS